jgi:hypothetical protein
MWSTNFGVGRSRRAFSRGSAPPQPYSRVLWIVFTAAASSVICTAVIIRSLEPDDVAVPDTTDMPVVTPPANASTDDADDNDRPEHAPPSWVEKQNDKDVDAADGDAYDGMEKPAPIARRARPSAGDGEADPDDSDSE